METQYEAQTPQPTSDVRKMEELHRQGRVGRIEVVRTTADGHEHRQVSFLPVVSLIELAEQEQLRNLQN